MSLIAFNKPMNVLSQFTSEGGWPALDGFGLPKGVYAAGRLDRDSEGLLLLTDDGRLQARISSPKTGTEKTYLALVEGVPGLEQMAYSAQGGHAQGWAGAGGTRRDHRGAGLALAP